MVEKTDLLNLSKQELLKQVETISKDRSELVKENMSLRYFISSVVGSLEALIKYGELKEPLSFKIVNNEEFEKKFNIKL